MPMTESLSLLSAFAMGLLVGTLFFGGLLWTVRRGVRSQRPEVWFLGSMLARMSIALTGFYLVGGEHWERWLLCLVGFILTRLIVQLGSRIRQAGYAP
jgi:F1F0 ATPase subunit 2